MKTKLPVETAILKFRPLLICVIAVMLSASAQALTVNQPVTPAYVRDHPKEFSVKVAKDKDGLIEFRITRIVPKQMYFVARLEVWHGGKIIASSSTPSFGKKQDNDFWFSISPGDLAGSKFELGESSIAVSGDNVVPVVGTINYQFSLREFVPDDLFKPAPDQ